MSRGSEPSGGRVTGPVAGLFDGLVEMLAPTRCAGCDLPGTLLCGRCEGALPLIAAEEACPRCGAPGGARWCGECCGSDFAFDGMRCAGVFEPPLSRCVTLYKDAGELRLSPVLADLMADAVSGWIGWIGGVGGVDAVVPVPPSPGALARRGFDHTARLACDLGRTVGLPAADVLAGRPRRDQRSLSRGRRLANAAGSIRVLPGVTVPARVLVVDDVFTTGATTDAAATVLKAAGASLVLVVTAARACG